MKRKIKRGLNLFLMAFLIVAAIAGCNKKDDVQSSSTKEEGKIKVVATTTMLADLSQIIGGDRTEVSGLMGVGIDPHLYQASAGDVTLMQEADVVVYNGLHLEGKMGEIFEQLSGQDKNVISLESGLDESKLLAAEDEESVHDPHIWFDVMIWKDAAKIVADGLTKADPEGKEMYEANLEAYLSELDATDQYIKDRVSEIPQESRVLVTAHDAFRYFGRAYGIEVRGLQGISTEAEAGTNDVSALADFITERKIKAVFVESSVPTKTVEALQSAVKAKGFEVGIGGELYSDSLGDPGTEHGTYVGTMKANIDTIVNALK